MHTIRWLRNTVANTERELMPALWANFPRKEVLTDPGLGFFFFDDFLNFSQHVSDQDVQQYSSYIDTGVTIKALPVEYGVLEVAGNDADNDEGSIQAQGNSGTQTVITSGDAVKKVAFECRVKKASIAANALAYFVGLGEEGFAVADALVNDTGAVADKDFIGFSVLHDSGAEVDFTWKKNGQTVQLHAAVATMAADTYVRLGFLYDATAPTANRIKIFVDNLEASVYVTGAQIAAATFPSGEELAMILATKVGAAAESKFQMDYWALGVTY